MRIRIPDLVLNPEEPSPQVRNRGMTGPNMNMCPPKIKKKSSGSATGLESYPSVSKCHMRCSLNR